MPWHSLYPAVGMLFISNSESLHDKLNPNQTPCSIVPAHKYKHKQKNNLHSGEIFSDVTWPPLGPKRKKKRFCWPFLAPKNPFLNLIFVKPKPRHRLTVASFDGSSLVEVVGVLECCPSLLYHCPWLTIHKRPWLPQRRPCPSILS